MLAEMRVGLHVKCLLFLSDFNKTGVYRHIECKSQIGSWKSDMLVGVVKETVNS